MVVRAIPLSVSQSRGAKGRLALSWEEKGVTSLQRGQGGEKEGECAEEQTCSGTDAFLAQLALIWKPEVRVQAKMWGALGNPFYVHCPDSHDAKWLSGQSGRLSVNSLVRLLLSWDRQGLPSGEQGFTNLE